MRKLMSITRIAIITTMGSLLGFGAVVHAADTNQHGQLSKKDYKFAQEAVQGNLLEVKLGAMAKEKGANPAVQQFGDQMIQDHSKAIAELKDIAMKKGATLPTQLTHGEENEWEHLQKLSGKQFDKAYAEYMVKEHKKDIKEFQDAAKNAHDPDMKAFAQKTVPVLQQHEHMAQQMESTVKQQEP